MTCSERPAAPTTGWVAKHVDEYVASDGADGHIWKGAPTLLLTTRDRRSGVLRRTPLIYGESGGAYVVVGSQGGRPDHPGWYRNLRAEPEVTIQVIANVMSARARTAEGDERAELWSLMADIWPAYDTYQAKAERIIPVVVLEPTTT